MIRPHIYIIHWCGKICPHLEDISSNAVLTFELLVVPQIERHGAVCAFSRIQQISDSLCTCMGKPVMPSIDPQCTCAYRGVQSLTANVSRQLRPFMVTLHSFQCVATRLPLPTFQLPRRGGDSCQLQLKVQSFPVSVRSRSGLFPVHRTGL